MNDEGVVFDACSLINIINGEVINDILSLPGFEFFIGNIVNEECAEIDSQKTFIENLIHTHKIKLISDDVSLKEFLRLKRRYELGDGETESIAHAKNFKYVLSSDDHKARSSGLIELGKGKVIGSLYLLREAVRVKVLSCNAALAAYLIMKVKGGFLPNVDEEYICR